MKRIVIDVREPYEFASGHVDGSLNMPLSQIMDGSADMEALPKTAEIVLYCNSGNRSGIALKALQAAGFTHVLNGINQTTVESTYG